jgi:hypothetical protein
MLISLTKFWGVAKDGRTIASITLVREARLAVVVMSSFPGASGPGSRASPAGGPTSLLRLGLRHQTGVGAVISALVEAVVVGPAVHGRNYFDSSRVTIRWKA